MAKKRKPYIIKEINKLQLKPNDILVLHFDIDNFDVSECSTIYAKIIEVLPKDVSVIGMVGNIQLEVVEKVKEE